MISALYPVYFAIVSLVFACGLLVPLLSSHFVTMARTASQWIGWTGAAVLLVLVGQQAAALVAQELFGGGQRLPASAMTVLMELVVGVPNRSLGGVQPSWWLEELRFLSALVILLPLVSLGLGGQLLSVEHSGYLGRARTRAVVTISGGLIMALPMGLLLTTLGSEAAYRAIVSPRRGLTQTPALDQWVWENSVNVIGWGHPWAFKALVPILGMMLVMIGCLQALDALSRLRLGRLVGLSQRGEAADVRR